MGVKISIDKHLSELDDILEMSPHYLNKGIIQHNLRSVNMFQMGG